MRGFSAMFILSLAAACASLPAEQTQYVGETYSACNFGEGQFAAHALRSCGGNECSEKLRLGPGMMMTTLGSAPVSGWREVVIEGYAQDDTNKGQIGWVQSDHICKALPTS